jgi:hypothetical protein
VLNLESPERNWFTSEEVPCVRSLAYLAARAEHLDLQRERLSADALIRGSSERDDRLLRAFDDLLDRVLATFAPTSGLMAEVLLAIPDTQQLVTLRLRPDTSVALHIRLRADEGMTGRALPLGNPSMATCTASVPINGAREAASMSPTSTTPNRRWWCRCGAQAW